MVRIVGIVVPGSPPYVTQRGNRVTLTFVWADVVISHGIFPV